MNHSSHIEDRFSDLLDGTLEPQESASVQAHLESCAACRSGFEAFERSTNALRNLRLAPTSPAHVRDVQAAVQGPAKRRLGWPMLTHAAAILVGLGLAYGPRGCAQPTATPPTEVVREVRVEVPVEVTVEVPVEIERVVRVEVPIEIPVEVRVEVPIRVIEYVDRPVLNPQRFDHQRTQFMLANIEYALSEITHATNAPSPVPIDPGEPTAIVAVLPPDPDTPTSSMTPRVSSPLRIRRTGDQVRIHTRGTLEEIVPALIDTLNDPDQLVALAVEQHLESLRAELAGDESLKPLSGGGSSVEFDRPKGLRRLLPSSNHKPDPPLALTSHARWTSWWFNRSTR